MYIAVLAATANSQKEDYFNDEAHKIIRSYILQEYSNKTDVVSCMMEVLRHDGNIDEVYARLLIDPDDPGRGDLDIYFEYAQRKCSSSYFLSSPLGIACIVSIILVFLAMIGVCGRRFLLRN